MDVNSTAVNEISQEQHKHFPGLDTLRALAILMVIPRHAWELLGGEFTGPTLKRIFMHGWIGVELFFVLSGFLIGSQLFQSLQRHGTVSLKTFYLKRTFRILPAYYAVLALYYLWPAFREKPAIDPIWRFALFTMNYGRQGEAFSHAWSLCIEEHFYLAFPAMVLLAPQWPKFVTPLKIVAAILLGSLLISGFLYFTDAPFYPAVYRKTHTHLDGLVVGVTLAMIKCFRTQRWSTLTSRPYIAFTLGILLIAAGLCMPSAFAYVFSFSLLAFGFGCLLIAAVAPGFWLAQVAIPAVAFLASLAFTLYLTHKQMIHLAMMTVDDYKAQPTLTVILSVAYMTLAACALHYGVERPFLRLRDLVMLRSQTN